jgi:hypothetical protein
MSGPVTTRVLASTALGSCGVYQIGLGLYFIGVRPSMLPEDLRFMQSSAATLEAAAPAIGEWLQWVFAVMGGQMIALGALIVTIAFRIYQGADVSRGEAGALMAAAVASAALMSGVNFAIASDYRWALLVPVVLWCIALMSLGRGLRA